MKRIAKAYGLKLDQAKGRPATASTRFLCDEGLGGLARWLRALGYEAIWKPGLEDAELLKWAEEENLFFLTTDSVLMEFKLLRDGLLSSLWVPPTLKKHEQLAYVREKLGLMSLGSRCMDCGGEFLKVPKEKVANRIPPKTLVWLDEYWECSRCSKLFWQGTHWERLRTALE
jgi:uncharacterized protein